MEYEAVIGLEVHAQLRTDSKIFCSCSTSFGADPNTHTCPVCLGMPGVLPVLNERVMELAMKASLALNCTINPMSVFARKNYFYPDLPKGYQISQYELPLAEHGWIEIETEEYGKRRVGITRVHVEEDAGKNIHGGPDDPHSYVDLNRTGVPLIEIVSEPDIRHPEEARLYMQKLRMILRYVGASNADMEKGELRCDANISIRPKGSTELGVKTEIKNMNSFRHVQRALEYEIERQIEAVEAGERIVQETRLWNVEKGITESMRSKEEAHDYRYFPDPDLVPYVVSDEMLERVRSELPELPDAKKERFMEQYGLSSYDASLLISSREMADFFEEAAAACSSPKAVSNWMLGDLAGHMNADGADIGDLRFSPKDLARLVTLVDEGKISGKQAKEVLTVMYREGKDPDTVVKEKGMEQISDEAALIEVIKKVIAENPIEVEKFKAGKKKVVGFFVGQVMRATQNKANPKVVNQLLVKLLEEA